MPGVEVTSCEHRHLLLGLQVDQQALRHLRRGRRVDLRGPRGRACRRRSPGSGRRTRSRGSCRGCTCWRRSCPARSRLLRFFAGRRPCRRSRCSTAWWSWAWSFWLPWSGVVGGGFFGGFGRDRRERDLRRFDRRPAAAWLWLGVVAAPPGVTGVVAWWRGVVGVAGGATWATVVVTRARLARALAQAPRSAAAAAPSTRIATAPRIAAAERQPGVPRLSGRARAALQAPVLAGSHRRAALGAARRLDRRRLGAPAGPGIRRRRRPAAEPVAAAPGRYRAAGRRSRRATRPRESEF